MSHRDPPPWLAWAREIQALSQTGLYFGQDHFDVQRYRRLMALAAEMVAAHTQLAAAELLEGFAAEPGYATVKVDVRGAVVREGQILLVQERSDGRWAMPGGWADVGETPREMVTREVVEESGVDVAVERLLGVYDANRQRPLQFFHAYKLVFLCRFKGGTPRGSDETSAAAFFPFDALPPLSTFRTDSRHLRDVQQRLQEPHLGAAFD
ncbi:MAG: NUDIX hydrolase [Candidatus Competibacterales bacterium]